VCFLFFFLRFREKKKANNEIEALFDIAQAEEDRDG